MKRTLIILIVLLSIASQSNGQLVVTPNQTASQLVQKLLGSGITVSNEILTCAVGASGKFTAIATNLNIDSGILLTSGSAVNLPGSATQSISVSTPNDFSDSDLAILIGATNSDIHDACKLEFDFIPTGDTVKFKYVFGSDEYPIFNCSNFNDVFGFFISGPGIVGKKNIALVPGTSIPVAINSVNSGANLGPLCTSMGPGSPFVNYYVNNSNGATIQYNGFTQVFTAIASTIPCSTYHIKLAVADKGDQILDSGVFLEAGSLTSNGIQLNNKTSLLTLPTPYVVEGCMPIKIKFNVPTPKAIPLNLTFQWSGTAQNGVDYPMQPSNHTIPAFWNSDSLIFTPFADGLTEGLESINLKVYNNTGCSNTLLDSIFFLINDSVIISVSPASDTICLGDSIHFSVNSDTSVSLAWSPAISLTSTNTTNPVGFPSVSTVYQLQATYNGCPISHREIPITVLNFFTANAGPDDTICVGVNYPLNVVTGPPGFNFAYNWSPGTLLSDSTIVNPVFTSLTTGLQQVIVKATSDSGCYVKDTVNILVIPNSFVLHNKDTQICKGNSVQMDITGSNLWNYTWSPSTYLNDPNLVEPLSTPDSSITYLVVGSYPGCTPYAQQFAIDVQPSPIVVDLGLDRVICSYDSVILYPDIEPSWYSNYSYSWTPSNLFAIPTVKNALFKKFQNTSNVMLTVTTPAGCVGTDDLNITVNSGDFLNPSNIDTFICSPAQFQLGITGGQSHLWTPSQYLSDSTIVDPIISPASPVHYELHSTSADGCKDTAYVTIQEYPKAILELGPDLEVYSDAVVNLNALGNCSYFNWTPYTFLSGFNVSNPILSGVYSDQTYIVNGSTENGCTTTDTLKVYYRDGTVLELASAFDPSQGDLKIIKRGNLKLNFYRIFNRWGELIFETADFNQGWDGMYKGVSQPIGTYIYVIEATNGLGQRLNKTGNFLLLK